jgi:hypothetical protein
VRLPPGVSNWVGESLATQVHDTYREITEKKPRGDLK